MVFIVVAEEIVAIFGEAVFEDALTNFFGEANDEAEVVGGGEAIILGFFLGVARTPKST